MRKPGSHLLKWLCEEIIYNREIQALSHHNTAFHQLLGPLPRHEFEGLARQYHRGQKLRSVSRWDQFVGMLLPQLSGSQSLRDIEANLHRQSHKLYHLGAKPVAKSSLSRLNAKQPHELYQALFHKLLGKLQPLSGKHKFRFKNPLYSLDASLISLSLELFPWAHTQTNKAALKLHVGLNHGTLIPEFVALGDGRESELIPARAFEFPQGSIIACDKGYVDYGWYKSLTDKGIFFVSRLRTRAVYKVVERHTVPMGSGVTSDQTIQLNSHHALKRGAPLLRRVGYRDPDSGKHYVFLTNHFGLSAKTIAAIYKDRWQIEIFFKTLKQNLKLKTFLGTNKNAIMTQVWIAMCAYLLVAYARFVSKTQLAISRIIKLLQLSLFERRSLPELLTPPLPPDKKSEPQMRFAL